MLSLFVALGALGVSECLPGRGAPTNQNVDDIVARIQYRIATQLVLHTPRRGVSMCTRSKSRAKHPLLFISDNTSIVTTTSCSAAPQQQQQEKGREQEQVQQVQQQEQQERPLESLGESLLESPEEGKDEDGVERGGDEEKTDTDRVARTLMDSTALEPTPPPTEAAAESAAPSGNEAAEARAARAENDLPRKSSVEPRRSSGQLDRDSGLGGMISPRPGEQSDVPEDDPQGCEVEAGGG